MLFCKTILQMTNPILKCLDLSGQIRDAHVAGDVWCSLKPSFDISLFAYCITLIEDYQRPFSALWDTKPVARTERYAIRVLCVGFYKINNHAYAPGLLYKRFNRGRYSLFAFLSHRVRGWCARGPRIESGGNHPLLLHYCASDARICIFFSNPSITNVYYS